MKRTLIALSSSILLFVSCDQPTTVATPTFASSKIGQYDYNCDNRSPVDMTISGQGTILLTVTNQEPIQFYQKVVYQPNNYNAPTVTLQNGATSTGTQKLWYVDRMDYDVPTSGNYKLQAYYIEYGMLSPSYASTGNTSSCFNPVTNGCYRWTKQVLINGGEVPRYSHPTVFIDTQDPDGFVGKCQ